MKLFLAFVHDLYENFDWAVHCDPDAPVFSFRMTEQEDEYCTLEISREQTGWGFLAASQPKNVLVSWSSTGLPIHAQLIARGRVNELPGDLLGRRQILRCVCAARDVDDQVLWYAKTNLSDGPETNLFFSDADPEDAATYLLGRSAVYHVDPVTHEIRTTGEADGDRIVDMTSTAFFENGAASDGPGEYGKPVKRLRARLQVDFTQEASGTCDVGPLVRSPRNLAQPFATLDPDFAQNLQSMLTTEAAEGWSMADGGYHYTVRVSETSKINTGTKYNRVESMEINWELGGSYFPTRSTWHDCAASFERHDLTSVTLLMRFDYSQPRSEVIYAALDLPLLETGVEDEEDEIVELSLKNPFEDPRARDYVPGEEYLAGDVVRYDGEFYSCVADHYSQDFRQARTTIETTKIPTRPGRYMQTHATSATYWTLLEDAVRPSIYSFADTGKGQEIVRHLMFRLRKEGIRRMRARRISMRFRWEDAAHLRRTDSIEILVPWGGVLKKISGRVLRITREWPENGPATISVEIGVVFAQIAEGIETSPYTASPYTASPYTTGDAVRGDMTYVVEADPIEKPVVVESLWSRNYSVQSLRMGNDGIAQFAAAKLLASRSEDVRKCTQIRPSWATLQMRSLATRDTIRREIDVVGELVRAPGGVGVSL